MLLPLYLTIGFGEQNGLTLILTYVYLFRICCMFAFNFKKNTPIYEFSFLQYDDHLLQIMPALRLTPEAERSQDVDLLRQVRATTPQDPMGSEKNVGHFCHPIIPSSHHPIIRNMFQNHHPIWHWALLIGGVTGCPWFGSWRRRVWKPNGLKDTWWRGRPPMNISHGVGLFVKGSHNPILTWLSTTCKSWNDPPSRCQSNNRIPWIYPKITIFLLHIWLLRDILVVIT